MPRPQRSRLICREPVVDWFTPVGIGNGTTIELTIDEFEVLRLIDYEHRTHEQCAQHMGISRSTVTEMCEKARRKLMDALVNGASLHISGGNYHLCNQERKTQCGGCSCGCETPCDKAVINNE